jgi:exodeoxyribonuclease V alpha subunit
MTDLTIDEPPYNDGVSEAPSSLQATANLERYLAGDPAFQGIGVKRARDLAEHFGAGLHAALAGQDEAVAEVVGEERAAALFVAYSLKLIEADIVAWLDEHGIAPTVGLKIVRCWGKIGAARLKQNPFC